MKFEVRSKRGKVLAAFESKTFDFDIVDLSHEKPRVKVEKREKDSFQESLIDSLMGVDKLTDWESEFLDTLSRVDSLSEKQISHLNKMSKKYL